MEKASAIPYVEVGIGIVVRGGGEVLICRRKEGGSFSGYWEFPGGKCEAGESPEACVVRELKEELSIDVVAGERLERIEHQYPKARVVLHPFICRMTGGVPKAVSAAEFRWVGGTSLREYQFPEANGGLIERLVARFEAGAIDLGVGGA